MLKVAHLLDRAHNHTAHSDVVKAQMEKLVHPELTPSAQVMETIFTDYDSFFDFAMSRAQDTARHFSKQPLGSTEAAAFLKEARRSLEAQRRIEAEDDITFEQYLRDFFAQDACC
jgi:glutamate--cysteine ligase